MANPSKKKGTAWEVIVKDFLNVALARIGLKLDRAPLHGTKDIGDIAGLHIGGVRLAMGCKATKELRPVEWMRRGAIIKENAHADAYAEVYKPRGVGRATAGHGIVMMRLDDFSEMLAKLAGGRTCSAVLEGGRASCDECGHILRSERGERYCPGCGCKITGTIKLGGVD